MDDELRRLAIARLEARNRLARFALSWLGVSVLLVVIWLLTSPGEYFWPAWAIAGMGIGVAVKAAAYVGVGQRPMTDAAIAAEADKLSRRR